MSGTSIFLSVLSVLTFVGVLFGLIFIFKMHALMVLPGLLLFGIPVAIRAKALDASSGRVDKAIAKFVVPALAVVAGFLMIMFINFWL